jgi:magnesium-protoporphyrin O-methyltransferase
LNSDILMSTLTSTYVEKRGNVQTYFDVTAADTWAKLTSDAPVSRIRATVRKGRDQMRSTLLSWLPEDLTGMRLLDAGCGTGALATEAAERGAEVLAIDLSPNLVNVARERTPKHLNIDFRAGDLLDPSLGTFDYVVSMDCLIHYSAEDAVNVLENLGARTRRSMAFTFAPANPLLMAAWHVGKMFPRKDRSPSIVPVAASHLRHLIIASPKLPQWRCNRSQRVKSGFYTSQALELTRA